MNKENNTVAKYLKEEYNSRSKYLHEGVKFSSENYSGISNPQLSSTTKSGFKKQLPMYNDILLKDFCSYIIRHSLENNIIFE